MAKRVTQHWPADWATMYTWNLARNLATQEQALEVSRLRLIQDNPALDRYTRTRRIFRELKRQ